MQIELSDAFKDNLIANCTAHCADEANVKEEAITIEKITLLPNHEVDIDYSVEHKNFERIRRISGYLSSTDTWNDSKKCEERDRVAHSI